VHDAGPQDPAPTLLRAGRRVSAASMAWTLVLSTGAVAVGAAANSLVLVAFGLTGALDAAGSATLVVRFHHALRHESSYEGHERIALRVVTCGMIALGIATAAESARRLAEQVRSSPVPAGVALAAVSAAVLAALSLRKRDVARAIPSPALLADSWLSATGALLAVATVVGTALGAGVGWWWVDPVAAAAVAGAAVVAGFGLARG